MLAHIARTFQTAYSYNAYEIWTLKKTHVRLIINAYVYKIFPEISPEFDLLQIRQLVNQNFSKKKKKKIGKAGSRSLKENFDSHQSLSIIMWQLT